MHVVYVWDHVLQTRCIGQSREEGCGQGVVRAAVPVVHHQHCHHPIEGKVRREELEKVCQEYGDGFKWGWGGGGVRGSGMGGHSGGQESQCSTGGVIM